MKTDQKEGLFSKAQPKFFTFHFSFFTFFHEKSS